MWRKPQLGIMQVTCRWQGTFSRTLISGKDIFCPWQNAKAKECGENIRVWVGGKKGQGRRRCKEDVQKTKKPRTHTPICFESKFHNNNTHCIHSQKCTSRHTWWLFFLQLPCEMDLTAHPRNKTKGFKRDNVTPMWVSIIIQNTRFSRTLISEKTLFLDKMQIQRELRKSQFGWGKKRAGKKKKKMMMMMMMMQGCCTSSRNSCALWSPLPPPPPRTLLLQKELWNSERERALKFWKRNVLLLMELMLQTLSPSIALHRLPSFPYSPFSFRNPLLQLATRFPHPPKRPSQTNGRSEFIYKMLQTYIKMNMRWLWLQKYLKHMFPQGTWTFPWGKFIVF